MTTLEFISRRQFLRGPERETDYLANFGRSVSRQLPHLLCERRFEFGTCDKIFCSEWLSETNVVIGTKCNKLCVVDTIEGVRIELPTLNTKRKEDNNSFSTGNTESVSSSGSSNAGTGIHSVCLSPDRNHLAVGRGNDLALYSAPELSPLALGKVHSDWIFDLQWITDSLLISASRDSSMALWAVNGPDGDCYSLAEEVNLLSPIFNFSNQPSLMENGSSTSGERVRSLTYNPHDYVLGSLQAGPCSAAIHFWDVFVFQQLCQFPLPYPSETVCLEFDNYNETPLFVVGSRSHVTLIDKRLADYQNAGIIESPDKDCGVRSLQFNEHLLSIGTGAGHLYFYDIRAAKFLSKPGSSELCSLHSSKGWLKKDDTFREFFGGLPLPPSSIYTHRYNSSKTKIFTAGGPLPLGLCGNYAALWT